MGSRFATFPTDFIRSCQLTSTLPPRAFPPLALSTTCANAGTSLMANHASSSDVYDSIRSSQLPHAHCSCFVVRNDPLMLTHVLYELVCTRLNAGSCKSSTP